MVSDENLYKKFTDFEGAYQWHHNREEQTAQLNEIRSKVISEGKTRRGRRALSDNIKVSNAVRKGIGGNVQAKSLKARFVRLQKLQKPLSEYNKIKG